MQGRYHVLMGRDSLPYPTEVEGLRKAPKPLRDHPRYVRDGYNPPFAGLG
jgi:hypothetical protein